MISKILYLIVLLEKQIYNKHNKIIALKEIKILKIIEF